MAWKNSIPEWKNTGTEPSEELKTKGFQGGYKPPAGIFNWFWSLVSKAINELQGAATTQSETLDNHTNASNPHGITPDKIDGAKKDLSNVDDEVFKQKTKNSGAISEAFSYSTIDLNAGESELETGKVHFVYE